MVSALRDHDALVGVGLALDHIDEAVLAGYPARPEAMELTLEWLGSSHAGEWMSPRIFDQFIEPLMRVGVVVAPIEVIVPPVVGEMDPQAFFRAFPGTTSSRSWAPPA
jgi:hypothetical protein